MSGSVMHALEIAKRQELQDELERVTAERDRLREALEDCEMWFAELKGTKYDSEGAVTAQLAEIRAAIAKARGEG